MQNPRDEVDIALVGKYVEYEDSYKSLKEALLHGGIAHNVKVNIHWIEAESFEKGTAGARAGSIDGILVPGGFGKRGIEGMINAIEYARVTEGAVFRDLSRDADHGDRIRAQRVRADGREFDRVRSGDAAARDLQAARIEGHRRTGRHDAAGRVALRAEARQLARAGLRDAARSANAIGIGTNSTANSKRC